MLPLEPSVVALLGGLLLALSRLDATEVAKDVEWPTLVFFARPVRHGRRPGRHRPSSTRAEHRISFWGFTKYGLIVTVISVALAVPYLRLRFFAF